MTTSGTAGMTAILAEDINQEHQLARSYAETAIMHAIRCGELLTAKKTELPHGSFKAWIAANCEFKYSTAARYMKAAAQISTGVDISTLSEVFGSGKPRRKSTSIEPDDPPGFGVDADIGMRSGQMTIGIDVTEEPAIVLFESRSYPGYWHDFDVRDGSVSCRPRRADLVSRDVSSTRRRFSWSNFPDDDEFRGIVGDETEKSL